MRTTLLILTIGLVSTISLRADTYPRQPGVDAIHYVFRLTITDANNEIAGESTATVKFVTAGVKEFVLDLTSASAGKGMTVSSVTCNGQPVQFSHSADQLHIPLAQPPKPGDELQCTTSYRGIPAGGLRLIDNIHGERTACSARTGPTTRGSGCR